MVDKTKHLTVMNTYDSYLLQHFKSFCHSDDGARSIRFAAFLFHGLLLMGLAARLHFGRSCEDTILPVVSSAYYDSYDSSYILLALPIFFDSRRHYRRRVMGLIQRHSAREWATIFLFSLHMLTMSTTARIPSPLFFQILQTCISCIIPIPTVLVRQMTNKAWMARSSREAY